MSKYINVDTYGRCGTLDAPRGLEKAIATGYKFYLAFENSLCEDYATEKLYRILHMPLEDLPPVPIVMGPTKAWYNTHLPHNSFIHIDDYAGPQELAKYLQYLSKNQTAYSEFFAWKINTVLKGEEPLHCKTCRALLDHKPQQRLEIKDFGAFWHQNQCREGQAKTWYQKVAGLIGH